MNLSSLYKNEDWWAVWLGFIIIGLSSRWIFPRIAVWNALPDFRLDYWSLVANIVLLALATLIPLLIMGKVRAGKYVPGFIILTALTAVSLAISKQALISKWGIEYVIWALLIGLALGNLMHLPEFLKQALQSEFFIKTGLVLLGAEILLQSLAVAGILGVFEITVGVAIVWYFCYWLGRRMGMGKSFASIMATATSICGVSAAIAAGGAIKGDKKEVSYVISLVLLFALPMAFLLPTVGKFLGLSGAVVGAWIGGTIDTTPAVVASGALFSDRAMQIASVVKMSQNIMIGLAAFLLAIWMARSSTSGADKPKKIEIWYRFPKFVLGFIAASLLFSLLPAIGFATGGILSVTKELRGWLFAMAFISIGASTNFKELIKMGGGKPLLVFLAASGLDVVVSLISAMFFFGGVA